MKLLNVYEIRARYIPAIIAALPAIILSAFIKQDVWISLFENARCFLIVENLSLSLIAILFLIHVQRGIAKHLFENRIFKAGKEFPTTTMLLLSDSFFSVEMKNKIRGKIETDFGIRLCPLEQEQANIEEAKKTIRDAVNLIRKQVKDGDKTLQYNIHYGLSRNLIAGSIFAIPVSVLNAVLFGIHNPAGFYISLLMTAFFSLTLIFNRKILIHYASAYAECLLSEFLTTKGANHD
ncbi:MAG TPA: hypothetical protein PKI68_02990 [Pontiellaceae bacterium]|nr:hypothetical protein [Pontiellaceae bacterium]